MLCVLLMIQLFAWLNTKDIVKNCTKDLMTREDENAIQKNVRLKITFDGP